MGLLKKLCLWVGMCAVAVPMVAHATTMCATDDTIAIVLDPMIGGSTNSHNADLFEWNTTFSYGTVFGIATCVDTAGSSNQVVAELKSSDGTVATGGERSGRYCWCQMTHPARSRWVFLFAYGSVDSCGSGCAFLCGDYVRGSSGFRSAVFGSLGD